MGAQERLVELELSLPRVPTPVGSYVPAIRHGGIVRTTGQLPFRDGSLLFTGRVGVDITVEQGRAAARQSALNALAAAAELVGGIGNITGVIEVTGHIACAPDFAEHPAVLDGASSLMGAIFGDAGKHVRTNVGVASLPLGSPVEIGIVVTAEPQY